MGAWEVFKFKGATATPKLTIRKGGQIGLNSAAVRKYKLEKYKYVVLLINKEECKIGIMPTNNEDAIGKRNFRVIQGGATIPAKSFVEYYELNKVKEKRMETDWDEEQSMITAKYDI